MHDGDTFRMTSGVNGRLYGVDAFELGQTGRSPTGDAVPLGQLARSAFAPFAQPSATVGRVGPSTYGRPVVTLDNGGDAGTAMLKQGWGLATPEYLKADPSRLHDYMEAERDARLNRRGAFGNTFQAPSTFRHGAPDPWARADYRDTAKPGDTAVFWDEATPFQGLRPDIAAGYVAVTDDPKSTPADAMAYAKAHGFDLDPADVAKFYSARAKGGRPSGGVTYKDAPRVLTDPGDGKLGTTLRGVADPLNMLDEAGAVVDTLGGTGGRESLFNSDRRFGDILANNLDQNRSILAHDDASHPYYRMGGQIAGGLVLPGAAVEGVGFNAARAAIRNGATRYAAELAAKTAVRNRLIIGGAAEGGASGFGTGENWTDRGTGALVGAGVGGTLGAVAGTAGQAIVDATTGRTALRAATLAEQLQRDRELTGTARQATAGPSPADLAGRMQDSADLVVRAKAAIARQPGMIAMDAEHGSEILQAPDLMEPSRAVDRIDVNARAAPLLGDVTEAQRAAQATRISPRDVLPIPSNTVASEEEAARIGAGMYQPVKAPNEANALSSRSIPSPTDGTKTIAKRGPLDLVSWLRSQGGIRAQGGELEHYGIGNAPRTGMDFAGGENRFGPLVSNNGMTYDEATMRAHEAGFFPDHAERPTVSEFLDTLNATHTGRNRAFRSEDLPEVDAFESQRALRHSVEGARERGAPLVEDRGQPVDLADLDRNAPPVTAYEEWGENAPRMAGNLRLDKLDSPQSIKRALTDTHARVGGFDAATRGRITHAETERLAGELGMTADDLLKRRKGQSLNAEEALASRQILAQSSTDLVNMARRMAAMDNPGDELEANFRQAWVRHVAIQEQVAGMTAEAGRALSAFRMTADSRALGSRVLPSLGDIAGGTARLKDVANKIVDLEKSGVGPGGINQFSAKALQPRFRDMAVELYYNMLLSGPRTHAVNVLSNTITALGQLPEHGLAAGIGGIANVARRAIGKADAEAVLFGEIGSRAAGMIQGAREGMREAARTFASGAPRDAVTKMEQQSQEAIGGMAGKIIRTPTRALAAEDEFFKAVARRSELAGLVMRTAKSEGLKGDALRKRAAELVANPTGDLLTKSFDYARYVTFQQPLGPVGQKITGVTESMPILKLIVPFVRTPTNILKYAIERSPGAVVLKEWRRDIAAGGPKRDLALARVTMGTGIAATIYQMAAAGQITGGGPADESALRLLKADGWQPYSFKIGDKYYSYQRLDPYSTVIGTAADLVDQERYMTDKQRENASFEVGAAILKNLSNKTWLSGMSSALEALNDPDRSAESFFSRTAGSIVVPTLAAQVAQVSDPVLRQASGPADRIRSRIPGLSDSLRPRRDVFGRPVEAGGGLGPDIVSPIWTSQAKNDPVVAALLDSGAKMSPPGKAKMTDEDYDRFQERAGAEVHRKLAELVRTPEWKRLPQEDRADEVSNVVKKARKLVKVSMFGQAMRAVPRRSAAMPPPPPGFTEVVPPAPPGFSEVVR
ncbi:hypothetical protein ASG11_09930 [Sphingomonas sp. Leaf357]|nr:hypothetical protein ASG11_09930 [Sphingomonas sp. Leaf357]